jgi:hypothetical protein
MICAVSIVWLWAKYAKGIMRVTKAKHHGKNLSKKEKGCSESPNSL